MTQDYDHNTHIASETETHHDETKEWLGVILPSKQQLLLQLVYCVCYLFSYIATIWHCDIPHPNIKTWYKWSDGQATLNPAQKEHATVSHIQPALVRWVTVLKAMLLLTAWQAAHPTQAAWSGNPAQQSQCPGYNAAPPCNNTQTVSLHSLQTSLIVISLWFAIYLVSWSSSLMNFSIRCSSGGRYLLMSDCTQATSLLPGTYHFSCML